MGDLVRHGLPCLDCGSSDAKAEYTDNYFCYSCKKSTLKKRKENKSTNKPVNNTLRPEKIKTYIIPQYTEMPYKALDYLKSYGITETEWDFYDIRYTENFYIYSNLKEKYVNMGPRLVFKYGKNPYDIEGRALDDSKIKYITVGDKEQLFKTFTETTKVAVIVEDMLSAIKVGRILPSVALRGTKMNRQQAKKLLELIEGEVIFWLDGDKAGKEATDKLTRLFEGKVGINVIRTKHDPKCYSTEALRLRLLKWL